MLKDAFNKVRISLRLYYSASPLRFGCVYATSTCKRLKPRLCSNGPFGPRQEPSMHGFGETGETNSRLLVFANCILGSQDSSHCSAIHPPYKLNRLIIYSKENIPFSTGIFKYGPLNATKVSYGTPYGSNAE